MVQLFRREEISEPPLLDEAFLARLGKHIGIAEVRELVADGLLDLSDRLDALDRHARQDEIEDVASLCHEIAGAAGHLGLTRLSLAAVDGVRRCRGGTDEAATDIVATILDARAASLEAANRFCVATGTVGPSADPETASE